MAVIGVDIGKEVFHLVGLGADGKIAFRRKIRRLSFKDAFEQLPPCIVGMEACLSAHFVSRTLRPLGHEPRIIPAIYTKPFVKGQKNDYNDAEAIAEAALRPNLRVVREKSQDQLDLQACHRVRSRLVSRRTATINQIRAFLIEQGIAVRAGLRALRKSLFAILENRKDEISPRMAKLICGLYGDWCHLDERIEAVTSEIEELSHVEPFEVTAAQPEGVLEAGKDPRPVTRHQKKIDAIVGVFSDNRGVGQGPLFVVHVPEKKVAGFTRDDDARLISRQFYVPSQACRHSSPPC